jgi:hypothetical protein
MAKYLINSTDIEIEEVSGTENLKFNLAPGNSLESQISNLSSNIGDLSNLTTPITNNLVGAINSIVERGTNTNGTYIKLADGTLMCYAYIQTGTHTYPQSFINSPLVIVTPVDGNTSTMHMCQITTTTSQITTISYYNNINTNNWVNDPDVFVNYLAIGRWK